MGGLMFLGTYTTLFDSAISPWTTLGMRVFLCCNGCYICFAFFSFFSVYGGFSLQFFEIVIFIDRPLGSSYFRIVVGRRLFRLQTTFE
jgi:hypothetical protein